MSRYALRRFVQAIPTLFGATLFGFLLIHMAPGDPVQFFAFGATDMSPEDLQRLRHLYGLDAPLAVQYFNWLVQLAQLDLGRSFITHQPVLGAILERVPATLLLSVTALMLGTASGILVGILAGLRPGGVFDGLTRIIAVTGNAVPSFWLGLVFILLFSVHWRLFPSGNMYSLGSDGFHLGDRLWHLFPPAFILSLGGLAVISRYMRTQTLEVISQDYVRTARAKGLPENVVLTSHVLRNALLPLVTLLGGSLPGLFAGAVIIEYIFSWPGMGRMAVDAAFQRDYPVLMGLLLFLSVLVVLGNLLSDIAYGLVDPRIKLS